MTNEEFLNQKQLLEKEIAGLGYRIDQLRDDIQDLKAVGSRQKLFHSLPGDAAHVKTLNRIWGLEEKQAVRKCELQKLNQQIDAGIDRMSDYVDQTLLRYRFVQCLPIRSIACRMDMAKTTAARKLKAAISKFPMPLDPVTIANNERS